MTSKSNVGVQLQNTLYAWLLELPPDAPLPRMREIAKQMPNYFFADSYSISSAMVALGNQRRIRFRRGTRSKARGHYLIEIVATGRRHKTEGCPWEELQ